MFKKTYKFEGGINKGYCVDGNELIFQSGNLLRKFNLASKILLNEHLLDRVSIQKIVKNGNMFVGLSNSQICFFDSNLQNIDIRRFNYSEFNVFQNNYLINIKDFDYSTMKGRYGLFDLSLGSEIWEIDTGEIIIVESNLAFVASPKSIGLREIMSGDQIWSIEISNEYMQPVLIGVKEKLVIFGLRKAGKLIAIDFNTGQIVWERAAIIDGLKIDQNNNFIHQMMINYTKYDINTGEQIFSFINNEYFESIGIETQRSNYALMRKNIITTDYKKGNIGAFNTENYIFNWIHKEGGVNFPSSNPIIYNDPYLLVLDNIGDLHVFEEVNFIEPGHTTLKL